MRSEVFEDLVVPVKLVLDVLLGVTEGRDELGVQTVAQKTSQLLLEALRENGPADSIDGSIQRLEEGRSDPLLPYVRCHPSIPSRVFEY